MDSKLNVRFIPRIPLAMAVMALCCAGAGRASAQTFLFSSGNPDGRIATASRPGGSAGSPEIESADDFILTRETLIRQATFTGLIPAGTDVADVSEVVVEIYREFPLDSTFPADGRVPTRSNSPSDVAFDTRDSGANDLGVKLEFELEVVADDFTAANSVLNGISVNSQPEGPVSGQEVRFDVSFPRPFDLPAGHYFFVPQVKLNSGEFFWLSAPKPIADPGTPFLPDLQTWIRSEALAPDWLRVGADVVGGLPAPAFNGSFSLHGSVLRRD